jgi:hypothetical protein
VFDRLTRFMAVSRFCARDIGFAASVLKYVSGAVVLWFFLFIAGPVEGYYWPVVGQTRIVTLEPLADGFTIISGTSKKLRTDCKFDHIEWFLGLPGDDIRVDFALMEAAKNRAKGAFDFGPWKVQLTTDQILTKSHATVFHRCHDVVIFGRRVLSPWLTETEFWRSK